MKGRASSRDEYTHLTKAVHDLRGTASKHCDLQAMKLIEKEVSIVFIIKDISA